MPSYVFCISLTQFLPNLQKDIVCEDHNQRGSHYTIHNLGNERCVNMTAVDGSCDFCGTQTSDPEFPCSLGCTAFPSIINTTSVPINEFVEPRSCEWQELVDRQVREML